MHHVFSYRYIYIIFDLIILKYTFFLKSKTVTTSLTCRVSISLIKVTIGPVIPLPHNLNSPITVLLYVGCVSRHFCWRVGVPRPLCYPLYGFRCCTWGVCRVPSVGVCVSPVLRVTPRMGFSAVRASVLPLVWVSVLYVGCVSRPICGRVCVPRPLCEPVCGFGCTRGVFHVTIVGVWVSPVYCFINYMVSISTWGGHLFSHITQVNLLSP